MSFATYFSSAALSSWRASRRRGGRDLVQDLAQSLVAVGAVVLVATAAEMSFTVIDEDGEPTHANSIRSQSRDGSASLTPPVWNRGTSSMPTDLSCRWMISNVRARSWLPVVVGTGTTACRRSGTRRSCRCPRSAPPPVQPLPLSVLITFAWLNLHAAKFFLYGSSNGL